MVGFCEVNIGCGGQPLIDEAICDAFMHAEADGDGGDAEGGDEDVGAVKVEVEGSIIEWSLTLDVGQVGGAGDCTAHVERSCEGGEGSHFGGEEKVCDPWDAT